MREEWGPWIEHDGRGCPDIVGFDVEVVVERDKDLPKTRASQVETFGDLPWLWAIIPCEYKVIRYRIRKPRGLQILEALIADLPVPAPERQPEEVSA